MMSGSLRGCLGANYGHEPVFAPSVNYAGLLTSYEREGGEGGLLMVSKFQQTLKGWSFLKYLP